MQCVDINECLNNPCHANATCSNSIGSYKCTCKMLYVGNGASCTYISPTASVNPSTIRFTATPLLKTTVTTTSSTLMWDGNSAGVLQPLKFLIALELVFLVL